MKNTKKKGTIKSIILAAASILGLASLVGGKHKSNCSMCGMPAQHCIHKNKSA